MMVIDRLIRGRDIDCALVGYGLLFFLLITRPMHCLSKHMGPVVIMCVDA